MSKERKPHTKPKLIELVYKFKINQAHLADKIGISHSSFKNKLSETNELYNFSDSEYLAILNYIEETAKEYLLFLKKHDNIEIFKSYASKK